ncbi:MAG: hypothetical protein NWE89_15860 [Candidatus Bathyarchaeota archaeon]|nr:hypothetical protein [Candidatus Bathyarchaeota archaeon]
MDDIKVAIVRAEYHRNGIGGEGFYAAVIHCDGETLLATIPYKADGSTPDGESFDSCSCRVVDALDLSEHYRGDVIGDALIPKLEAYIKAREPKPKPAADDEEKNITKKFGCYSAELNIEREGDDLVSWCHVSCTRKGIEYCSSLGVVQTYGTIEAADGSDDITVPEAVVNRIETWADANGY